MLLSPFVSWKLLDVRGVTACRKSVRKSFEDCVKSLVKQIFEDELRVKFVVKVKSVKSRSKVSA